MNYFQDTASFRDRRGYIYHFEDQIFRTVQKQAAADFEFVRKTSLIDNLISTQKLLSEKQIQIPPFELSNKEVAYCLQHPKLPFISYPYEWSFTALKSAALLQLEILLMALADQITLTDSSAYNIQFQNARPVFIDHLAFRPYQPGEIWQGYKQFCEQFLNPLLMYAYRGLPYHSFYRANIEGISAETLKKILPFYRKLGPKVFLHVVLQASLQKTKQKEAEKIQNTINLPLTGFQKLLKNLFTWIETLHLPKKSQTIWQHYADEFQPPSEKVNLIVEFSRTIQAKLLYDLGCNTGFYSRLALKNGTQHCIGFDNDLGALERAFSLTQQDSLSFLPLYLDLANPSPNQGWNENERIGFLQRARPDGVLALALIHHLAISRNIPLQQLTNWLLNLAPQGVLEFVSKEDALVQEMLFSREDVFSDYSLENFLGYLSRQAEIVKKVILPGGTRCLIWYRVC
jgi:ribosomal protein L11 methylase PrmA